MCRIYTIYKAINLINNKCYIGIDINWPYRKNAHKSSVKRGSNLMFHNAIRKHGWENFHWEILYQSKDLEHTKNEMECYFIKKYNSHYVDGLGYNMTYGGEATLGWKPSEETKKRISESKKGNKTLTEIGRKIKSEFTKKNNPMNNPIYAEKARINRSKYYEITDPNGNKSIIRNLTEFCKKNNLSKSNMCSVSKGKLKHYKKWKCIQIITA